MPTDEARYRNLLERSTLNLSFFRGTWQDLSPRQAAMNPIGTPSWTYLNGLPVLRQQATNDRVESGVVAPLVDVTGSFSVEFVTATKSFDTNTLFQQFTAGAGGAYVYHNVGVNRFDLILRTAAGAVARQVQAPSSSAPYSTFIHQVTTSLAGGTSGLVWVRGVPVTPGLLGAGVAANVGNEQVLCYGGRAGMLLLRVFPFALTNEDVTALYQQARALTGKEV